MVFFKSLIFKEFLILSLGSDNDDTDYYVVKLYGGCMILMFDNFFELKFM